MQIQKIDLTWKLFLIELRFVIHGRCLYFFILTYLILFVEIAIELYALFNNGKHNVIALFHLFTKSFQVISK